MHCINVLLRNEEGILFMIIMLISYIRISCLLFSFSLLCNLLHSLFCASVVVVPVVDNKSEYITPFELLDLLVCNLHQSWPFCNHCIP